MEYASIAGLGTKRVEFSFDYYGLRLVMDDEKNNSFTNRMNLLLDRLDNGEYGIKNVKYLRAKFICSGERFGTCDLDFSIENDGKKQFTKEMEKLVLDICQIIQDHEYEEKEKCIKVYLSDTKKNVFKNIKREMKIKGDKIYE